MPRGLTATGLVSPAPREIRSWVERVRAGGLDSNESAATLALLYRTWLIALFLKMAGSGWDVAWHFRYNRDDFAPPHDINLIGDGLAIALVLFHWYTRFGVDKRAVRLMTVGTAVFVLAAPIDVINHRINGLDITSWSVTHFLLYTGTAIMIAGAIRGWRTQSSGRRDRIPFEPRSRADSLRSSDALPGHAPFEPRSRADSLRSSDALPGRALVLGVLWVFFLENVWFPNQHQEYGIQEIASWDHGRPFAEADLLGFAAHQMGRPVDREMVVMFSLPVPAWVYPLWIVTAVALTLVLARRSVGLRWTATTVAAGYLLWRCLAFPLLMAGGFPTSAVPFVVLAVGLAVDLVCLLKLAWPAEAALGAVVVTAAVYLGLFVQAYVLVAPPISYSSSFAAEAILFLAWAAVNGLLTRRNIDLF